MVWIEWISYPTIWDRQSSICYYPHTHFSSVPHCFQIFFFQGCLLIPLSRITKWRKIKKIKHSRHSSLYEWPETGHNWQEYFIFILLVHYSRAEAFEIWILSFTYFHLFIETQLNSLYFKLPGCAITWDSGNPGVTWYETFSSL